MNSFTHADYFVGFSERSDGNLPLDALSTSGVKSYWKQLLEANSIQTVLPRFAHQIHGDKIIELTADSSPGSQGDGDALVTTLPKIPIGVFTADCLPVIFASKNVIAAIHAGWKGTQMDIVGKTIAFIHQRYDVMPNSLEIFMGPCIGQCCLELGEEVPPKFFEADPSYAGFFSQGKKWHLDLRALNVHQCLRQGAEPANIKHVPFCTKCFPEKYFSYRGQKGRKGSMFSFVIKTR